MWKLIDSSLPLHRVLALNPHSVSHGRDDVSPEISRVQGTNRRITTTRPLSLRHVKFHSTPRPRSLPVLVVCISCLCACSSNAADGPKPASEVTVGTSQGNERRMLLHETRWTVNGKPVLGTYASGQDTLDDLHRVREIGMNLVIGHESALDPETPEGKFCLENGIKVMAHMTRHLYHGVKLREPITAVQTTIPLIYGGRRPDQESNIIQLDEELIRYGEMTDSGLIDCQRGFGGSEPSEHREGMILFWPRACALDVERVRNSPNLFGYYVLDDSPGDAVSALRAMYRTIHNADPGGERPVCAGFGDAGSLTNFDRHVCDLMLVYWYPVGKTMYHRESTSLELQHILTTARKRVPAVPFIGVYQAFDGAPADTGQGVPTPVQLREQLEDFVREGASGLIAYHARGGSLPGWADLPDLASTVRAANDEILSTGGLLVRPESDSMKRQRFQPEGFWQHPQPRPGVVPAWYVAGPFEDLDGKMLGAVFPPDQGIDMDAEFDIKFGKGKWRVRETTCGVLGLSNIFGDQTSVRNCLAYASCDLESPEMQTVQMRVGTDDDAIIRVNGEEVYRFEGARGITYDDDIVEITLPRGKSRIDLKIHNRAGLWGFVLRFTDAEGKPLDNLRFSPPVK